MTTEPTTYDLVVALALLRRAIAATPVNASYLLGLPDITDDEQTLVHKLIEATR